MNKALIIVESPTKARVIDKFLKGDYNVVSSMGHVRDLPRRRLGVDVENNFEPDYEIIKGKEKIIRKLSKLIKETDKIYLGMDEDREGESIGWHILQSSGIENTSRSADRIVFHEITPGAIKNALETPRRIDINLVNAQQARRILDRIVGYKLSPLLSKKIRKGLSAGRVQSVALKLVVEREKEREAFKPRDYYTVEGKLTNNAEELAARLWGKGGKKLNKFYLDKKEKAREVVDKCANADASVFNVVEKRVKKHPPPPFITSSLQQAAYAAFSLTPYSTMREAQKLYEGIELPDGSVAGLITYMRTDSVKISKEALKNARKLIGKKYGEKYLPPKPNFYRSKKTAQEAHECIRPTNVALHPREVKKSMTEKQFKLYSLIWKRFVASQMTPALIDRVRIDFKCAGYDFRATGQKVAFEGYTKLTPGSLQDEEVPGLEKGDLLKWSSLREKAHQTQPPPRYTMATLVKELENNGIGRPSTYASILNTLFKRKYIHSEKGSLVPVEIAMLVTENLKDHFSSIMDTEFTAKMEENLDRVAEGELNFKEMLEEFYRDFKEQFLAAKESMKKIKDTETDKECPDCSSPMVIRRGRNGKFMACTGFPECKKTYNIDSRGNILKEEKTEMKCPKCGSPMLVKRGRYGKFLACSKYPGCKTTLAVDSEGKLVNIPIGFEKCPQCGKNTTIKRGRKGMFLACTGFPGCRFSMNYEQALKKSKQ